MAVRLSQTFIHVQRMSEMEISEIGTSSFVFGRSTQGQSLSTRPNVRNPNDLVQILKVL